MNSINHFYLIRGLGRESQHWGDIADSFREYFPNCKVTLLDMPGMGVNRHLKTPWSISQMVRLMRNDYLHKKNKREISVLVVISLGGMVGAQWMKEFPKDFQFAVLMNTSYAGMSPTFKRLKPKAIWVLASSIFNSKRIREKRVLEISSNQTDVALQHLDRWLEIQRERPVLIGNVLRQLWAASRYRVGDWQPEIPVQVLASENDRMVNVECSRAIGRSWAAPVATHPTAGHDLPLDDRYWMLNQIEQFLLSDGDSVSA